MHGNRGKGQEVAEDVGTIAVESLGGTIPPPRVFPETVNEDPYGNGWMIKVSLADAAELDNLMDAAAYRESIAG